MSDIAIIGAGKAAASLANGLMGKNENVASIVSRSLKSARDLAQRIGIRNYSDSLSDIPRWVHLIFITVPDREIARVAEDLSRCDLDFENSLFCHISGAQNISLLKPLKEKGARTASLHIMQSFPSKNFVELRGAFAAVESSSPEAEKQLFRIAEKLEMRPFIIGSEDKIFYHIAGVFASNFLIANLFHAQQAFNKSRIEGVDFFSIIKPIVKATLENADREGVVRALSGPVERGDLEVVKNHLSVLKKASSPNNGETGGMDNIYLNYICQSISLLEIVKLKGQAESPSYKKMREFLICELKEAVAREEGEGVRGRK
ncbi:MAG: DUF2520 domain-containing protein [Ignavibacteria bacterium]|jgi:predicted short-subunit dehydrogenase-like oxidoreductase (DUF2520 family)|nr:DUF2520 domain-containing protein [Ignavibacteria bacterium]MCU7502744.1 DUF2520 domain-containing protein [Ignavibacteria bacterium]MCU7517327.1 DUF2520 domain-containing protein [Ignavibacteria bacterium]